VGGYDTDVTGECAAIAIQQAASNAGVRLEEIYYVSAHGESGKKIDKKESAAIRRAFGGRAFDVAVSSIKALIGHSLGASGAIQAATAALALHAGVVPQTWNYEKQDPDCDLDYVAGASRAALPGPALVNSYGLGGLNVSLVLGTA